MAVYKLFKVASISNNSNSFGLYGHIMMAEDGETWQVGRVRSGGLPARWERGQVIDVPLMMDPLRGIPRPSWEELHCEIPQLLPDASDAVLAEVWGKTVAAVEQSAAPQEVTPSIVFTADRFVADERHSAQEKADFANAFVRFVENGFQEAHFSESFYQRLTHTFGHIAHFNKKTFYRTFFGKARDKALFLRTTVEHEPIGNPAHTFSDVEQALQDWLLERKLVSRMERTAEHAQNRVEREELKRLLEKHGLPEDYQAP